MSSHNLLCPYGCPFLLAHTEEELTARVTDLKSKVLPGVRQGWWEIACNCSLGTWHSQAAALSGKKANEAPGGDGAPPTSQVSLPHLPR